MAEAEKTLTKEEKQQKIAEYKAKKQAEKAEAKKKADEKLAFEKTLTPDEKKRIAVRTKEIKAKKAADEKAKKAADKKAAKEEKDKIAAMPKEEAEKYKADQKAKKKVDGQALYEKKLAEKNAKLDALTEELNNRYDVGAAFRRFFHNLHISKFNRWFWEGWLKFSCLHPAGASIIHMIFFFIVFSEGVTIWQLLVMLFLPYAFQGLSSQAFVWPAVALWNWSDAGKDGASQMIWAIFNEPVVMKDGAVVAQGGLGNFIAFEIAVFTAQCINFPLQRNITFKSHGNPWYQAMWYFIGWVLISLVVNAVWGFVNPILLHTMGNEALVYALIKTFITGGISMVIFFFIFMIIFPGGPADTSKDEATKEICDADGKTIPYAI
jgi:hypothetical protein